MTSRPRQKNARTISAHQAEEMSAGSIILHELARTGASTFRQITHSSLARTLGAHLKENSYYTALARLHRRKMIDKGGYGYALTPNGEWMAVKAYIQRATINARNKTGSWDGRWRIIVFDFPEKKRAYRDYLRTTLQKNGFREFQRSTWICPFKVPAHLDRLFRDQRIEKHVRVITSQDINYDADLKKKFRLT